MIHERPFVLILLLTAILSLPTQNLFGATIAGRVSDPEGAPISGAQVIAQGPDANVSKTVVTREDGSFSLDPLPAGIYKLTVRRAGFGELVQQNVSVGDGEEPLRLNLRLRSNREQAVG